MTVFIQFINWYATEMKKIYRCDEVCVYQIRSTVVILKSNIRYFNGAGYKPSGNNDIGSYHPASVTSKDNADNGRKIN
jgi:hypothetical protein